MSNTAQQIPHRVVSGRRNAVVSCDGFLDTNEIIAGSPIVEEQVTNDLVISNISITTSETEINEKPVPAGKAILFSDTGGIVANSPYQIKLTWLTDSTPPQQMSGYVILEVIPG